MCLSTSTDEFMELEANPDISKMTEIIDSGLQEWKTATWKIISSRTGCKAKKLYHSQFFQLAVGKNNRYEYE